MNVANGTNESRTAPLAILETANFRIVEMIERGVLEHRLYQRLRTFGDEWVIAGGAAHQLFIRELGKAMHGAERTA